MTDPFEASFESLRTPIRPVDPDPLFAAALRDRLERALLDIEEPPMTTATAEKPDTLARLRTVAPYLTVTDALAAVDFYIDAFGAQLRSEPIRMPDGRIGHAEVAIGDSVLMLAEEYPEIDLLAPVTRGGSSLSLRLEVADPDRVVQRAVAGGATLERPVTDSPYGRGGVVIDPSGHRWMVSREPAPALRPGDVGYASLWRPDTAKTAEFYRAVLGWAVVGTEERSRRVTGLRMHLGMWGGERPGTYLCFMVPDVDEASVLVRAAGGTAQEATDEAYGRVAMCTDDQGLQFAVFTPPADGGSGPGAGGNGELDYFELQVPDATRARAFFSTVLGWRFRPGTAEGYWHMEVADGGFTVPMSGMVGGHTTAAVIPTFNVADLPAAVAAVRAAGGRAADPEPSRDGPTVECTDDQGAPFRLWHP